MDAEDKRKLDKLFDDPTNWKNIKVPSKLYEIFENHYPRLISEGHITDANTLAKLLKEVGANDPEGILPEIKKGEAKRIKAKNRKIRNLLEKGDKSIKIPPKVIDFEIKHSIWLQFRRWINQTPPRKATGPITDPNAEYINDDEYGHSGINGTRIIADCIGSAVEGRIHEISWYKHYWVKNKDNPALEGKPIQKKNPNDTLFHTSIRNRLRALVKNGILIKDDFNKSTEKMIVGYDFPTQAHQTAWIESSYSSNLSEYLDGKWKEPISINPNNKYLSWYSFMSLHREIIGYRAKGLPEKEIQDIIYKNNM